MPISSLPLATSPVVYAALGGVLLLVSVGSIWLIRSEWGRQRPLHRCVLLSLAAHLVLITIAAMIRFATWLPGEGSQEPLRITIVAAAPHPAPTAEPVDSPPLDPPQNGVDVAPPEPEETSVEPSQETQPDVDNLLPQPPDLLSQPAEAQAAAEPPPESAATDVAQLGTEQPVARIDAEAAEAIVATEVSGNMTTAADSSSPISVADSTSPPTTPPPAVPPALANRVRPDRLQSVIEQGGSRETEQAVGRALEWLAQAQSSDGRWDSDRWQGGREFIVLGHNRGGAGGHADTAISALALLTFLGAGHSHLEGPYAQNITAGLNFLIGSQASDGNLYGDATLYARTYCHSMATFALAEAYALTGDARLAPAVEHAVEFLVRSQHASNGGWRYRPGDPGDVSQLGWIIMALRSAELAGVDVPDATWQRIEHFLRLVARGQHGGLAAYQPQSGVSRAMTAEALYCRQVLGKPLGGAALNEALAALSGELPGDGDVNLYYWYYATLALHHAQHQGSASQHTWDQWNERLKRTLLAAQVTDGANTGSWSPNTVWGGYGGRVYSTAMAAMCLEVYYRFGADTGKNSPWVASRPRGEGPVR